MAVQVRCGCTRHEKAAAAGHCVWAVMPHPRPTSPTTLQVLSHAVYVSNSCGCHKSPPPLPNTKPILRYDVHLVFLLVEIGWRFLFSPHNGLFFVCFFVGGKKKTIVWKKETLNIFVHLSTGSKLAIASPSMPLMSFSPKKNTGHHKLWLVTPLQLPQWVIVYLLFLLLLFMSLGHLALLSDFFFFALYLCNDNTFHSFNGIMRV